MVDPRFPYYYRPQTKLREGNVFTPVCQSFYSQGGGSGGGCIPACNGLGCIPACIEQGRVSQHAMGASASRSRRCLPMSLGVSASEYAGVYPPDTPPWQTPPPDCHISGRYASYWNGFLFFQFPPKLHKNTNLAERGISIFALYLQTAD